MADPRSIYQNVVQKLLSSLVGSATAANTVNNTEQQQQPQTPSGGILGKLYESMGYSNPTTETTNPVTDTISWAGQPTYATATQSDNEKPQGTPDAEKTNNKEQESEEQEKV